LVRVRRGVIWVRCVGLFTRSEGERGGGDALAGSAGCVPVVHVVPDVASFPRVIDSLAGCVGLPGCFGVVVCGPVPRVLVAVVTCAAPWPGRIGWVPFCHLCSLSLFVCLKGQVGAARVTGLSRARPGSLLPLVLLIRWSVLRMGAWRHAMFSLSARAVWCTLKNVVCGLFVTYCVSCGALIELFVFPFVGTLIAFWG
jgi:hypothetical protein